MIRAFALAALAAPLFAAQLPAQGPASGPQQLTIDEWNVPWQRTRPRDPYVDAQGKVWFVGQVGDYIGVLDPATGQFRRYDLDHGAGPHNLIVDARGFVWYSGNTASHIGRLDPASGAITKYPMPDSSVRDPHTMVFDRHGDIWFTAQQGNVQFRSRVARDEFGIFQTQIVGKKTR